MISLEQLYNKLLQSTGVSTDTRSILPGNIYFALTGENFNGNKFAKEALALGASYAVINNTKYAENDKYLIVEDVLVALQDLASHHRQTLNIPLIAITGSNGKTTTKELTREVLSATYNVLATEGNLNNHIGVPLTLLKLQRDTDIAIIEMGANHIGEIANLCKIAQPTHGLITNIGKAHLEGFGNYEGVLRAKSELYNYLIEHEGHIFVNSDDEVLRNMAKRISDPIYYNSPGDFYECTLVSANPYVYFLPENKREIHTKMIGIYNFKNIAAALCIAKFFKVDYKSANLAIANYTPSDNRSQIIDTKHNRLILDAYNANPVSMKAALDNLEKMDHPNKVVILGDMFELGKDTELEHLRVYGQVAKMDLAMAFFCGKASAEVTSGKPGVSVFESKGALENYLKEKPIKDCLVLLKGSRGMGLETLVEYL